jgi:chromosome segregation protein
MILKKLEIQGFKSFADRTEVLFTPGVIAVVGPNGSGKSNISDAILWVLGEQNVRTLRGTRAQDVIFSGSNKRKPVGMAEVSLTVDNTSGKLPLNFSEVTVTRRAFRSGESEFFINKTACRLKDIYELFMDTGVGREAYSIISQGEIDAVLSANPDDRRALFDEAAGIKKYRHRKKEAERKLETTQGNLNRVTDILHEIESEIEPMAEQAEIASRFLELTARLNEIEVGILVSELHKCTDEMRRIRDEKAADEKSIADTEALLQALEEEKSALATDLANADAQVERHSAMHQEALTHLERTESRLALANQTHSSSSVTEQIVTEEIAQIEVRIAQLESQRAGMIEERAQFEKAEAELASRLNEKQAQLTALQEKMDAASRAVDDQKANYIELAKQLATQRNELTNISAKIESLASLLEKRSLELRDAERDVTRSDDEKTKAEAELEVIKADLAEIQTAMRDLRVKVEEKRADGRKTAEELTQVGRTLVDRQSRLKTLREMEDAKEGYFHGVRSVTSAVKSGRIPGAFAVVADVIKVPRGYESAYEVALGSSLQDIITDSEDEAKGSIEFLKQNRAGRATFLPLNMMRHTASPGLKQIVGRNGVLGLANELLEFDSKYAPAINSLLGKVLVTQDIDSAIGASRAVMGWSKIVSLDGEVVFPSGAMSGGNAPGKTVNILGRKQEIETLESDCRELTDRSAKLEKARGSLDAEIERLASELKAVEDRDTALKMSLLEKERRLEFAVREAKRLTQERDSLLAEKEGLQNDLRKARENQAALAEAVETADRQNSSLDSLMAETDVRVRGLQVEYDAAMSLVNSANVEMASITQKRLSMEQSIEGASASVRDLGAEIKRKADQLSNTLQERSDAEVRRIELEAELGKARLSCEEMQAQADQWRKTKQSIVAAGMEVNDRIKEVVRGREQVTTRLHSSELKETRLEVQVSQATARLLEEYDITPEEAFRREAPEVKYGAATEVQRLRREIRGMGEVNTGAVQEYERLTERQQFLDTQRRDLMEARQKLIDAIREIDESTRDVFEETFHAVQKAFQEMFVRLFGDGKTELVLSQPDNMLESGIDVIVELPGKKRQNLQLLSGGERALTATALMFSLMIVRPSPFCVMDEVDAPLDEANVERFADLIREFAERSQMIVITHNRATMEKADVLYGVTMQEPGISKLVSVKLSDVPERN